MLTTLHRIIYVSRSLLRGDEDQVAVELRRILAVSRRNNASEGLTGALLLGQGSFAQVLEGPMGAVERAFERIQDDPRHADLVIVEVSPVAARTFADWSMAFAGTAAAVAAPRVRAVLDQVGVSPRAAAAENVVGLLDALIRRETEWAMAR